jgi:hypothetical protein
LTSWAIKVVVAMQDGCAEVGQQNSDRRVDRQTYLVVALETSPKLTDQASQEELAHLWKFGIDDSSHGRKDGSERQRGRLRSHHAPAVETSPTDEVLSKQLRDDLLDVGYVDLVDETIDGFPQGIPGHSLKLW